MFPQLELLSFFILELSLVQYEMLRFPLSLLAAAAVFTAQCTLTGCEMWSRTCERHTSYNKDELMSVGIYYELKLSKHDTLLMNHTVFSFSFRRECARLMVALHQNAGKGKLTGVFKKYSTCKYGYAAKMEAAVFLKDAE